MTVDTPERATRSAEPHPASVAAPPRVGWPWALLSAFFTIAFVGLWFVQRNGESLADQIPFVIAFGMFGVVGALILSRLPGNRIGALLLYGASIVAMSFLLGEVCTYLVRAGRTSGALVVSAAMISSIGWVLGILPVVLFLPLLFPDGHPPSSRWRPLAWISGGALAFLGFASIFGSKTLTGSSDAVTVRNPFYVSALERFAVSEVVVSAVLIAGLIGSLASLVVRFGRSGGIERQQIKWVAASVGLLIATFILTTVVDAGGGQNFLVDTVLSATAFLSIPVSIGVAVLQYRLYDLDVVVRRAVVAGSLALLAVGVYVAVVSILGAVTTGSRSSGTVFLIALLLGAAFRPVTRAARRLADRLVYGRRATPYEVLTEFSERVGDAYATEDVLTRMAQILAQGVGAGVARVWLVVGRELTPVSTWPPEAPVAAARRIDPDGLPAIAGETAVEVRDRGELLGALSVSMPANDPMTPAKEKLVRDLASQAGLVLRNVRLVEELKASQRRIVAAQDQERRRLERNIHDGAQQRLVALAVKARLARSLVGRDDDKATEMLDQIGGETQEALEDLRDLARGIYPPLLADKGLAAALEAQARKVPVPVAVEPDGIRRYAQPVEAAVYFSVLEALQNASKYADASVVRVRLAQRDGELAFEVSDDGRGFDPAAISYGMGLQGISDRLRALDGRLEVRSAPGSGTIVNGVIPVDR
jgi:signal transduction histidine kinase